MAVFGRVKRLGFLVYEDMDTGELLTGEAALDILHTAQGFARLSEFRGDELFNAGVEALMRYRNIDEREAEAALSRYIIAREEARQEGREMDFLADNPSP